MLPKRLRFSSSVVSQVVSAGVLVQEAGDFEGRRQGVVVAVAQQDYVLGQLVELLAEEFFGPSRGDEAHDILGRQDGAPAVANVELSILGESVFFEKVLVLESVEQVLPAGIDARCVVKRRCKGDQVHCWFCAWKETCFRMQR